MSDDILTKLNPEQKKAVTFGDGPLLIVAGAGTGKTTVITQRLAWLIQSGKAKADEILALTFTDKAAGEMEERVDRLLPYGYLDLWVSTFHSFCQRILQQHALDIGLSNNFRLLNQTEQWLLVRQNLDKFHLDYYRPLGNPTKFIHALVKHFSRCKDEEVGPKEYLEYAEKLKLGLDSAESAPQSSFATTGQAEGSQKFHPTGGHPQGEKVKSQNYNSKFKIKETDLQEIRRLEEIANAYHVYQQLLLDNNALDFGDLITYTLKLFRERPAILEKYRQQFKYILVDEFQDTNWAQYELVKLLAAPKNNLTMVADDDQSVYRFRGASMSNVLQFKQDYLQSQEIILVKNYRSCQNILDISYKFIQFNNPNRLEYQLSQGDYRGFKKKISKKLVADKKGKAVIEHLHFKTLDEEAAGVVKKISNLKISAKGGSASGGQISNLSWSDCAILVRANESANIFSQYLARAGIPYQFLALRGLYAKPIILDVIAYFKLLDNYHESSAMWRVLNLPIFGIPPADIIKITNQAYRKTESIFESIQKAATFQGLSEQSLAAIGRILGLIEKHSQLAREKSVSEIFLAFLQDSGYLKLLNQKDDQENRTKIDYLRQFYERIKKFEAAQIDSKLKDFMEELNLELEAGEEGSLKFDIEAGPEMVRIMTVHGAKGLEFKYVFIPNLVDLRFPTIDRRDPIELPDELVKEIIPEGDIHLQEERRLFYVAMTRAKEGVFFTSAEDYGGQRKKKISQFLIELGYSDDRTAIAVEKGMPELERPVSLSLKTTAIKDAGSYYLPQRFSFTQLAAFAKCPLQYKFAHILHIPVFGKPVFSFGKTMHLALQRFFQQWLGGAKSAQAKLFKDQKPADEKQKSIPSLEELLKIYEEAWVDEWYPTKTIKAEYRKRGREALKEYYKFLKKNPPRVKLLEQDFNVRIGNYTLRGRIDRIDDLEGGELEIIDYKTGRSKELEKMMSDDKKQLLIYQIAVEEVLQKKPGKLTYYYIENNKPVSFLGSGKELEQTKQEVIEEIEEIRESDFAPTPGWQCEYCDYNSICEYRTK